MNNDNSQKFTARPEIRMSTTLTPEKYSILKECSASIPTLYMLDICVIAATKLTEKSLKSQYRKARLVKRLRNLDRPENGFSYLFALMEKVSDSRGKLTTDKLKEQLLADISSLRKFFKKAEVLESDDLLILWLNLMGKPIEDKREEYLNFLKKLNNHFGLHNPISPKHRLDKAKEIILEATSLTIGKQHLTVIIALACLYGNNAAKKLMKFKAEHSQFDAENALADIQLLSRFARIKLEMEHRKSPYLRVNFITDDSALSALVKCFKPESVEYQEKRDRLDIQFTITAELEKLLTDLKGNKDEYDAIIDLLSSGESSMTNQE